MEIELIREGSIEGVGTPGILRCGKFEFYTIEREWVNNESFISCIPTGRYRLVPYSSEKYPDHYALVNEELGVYAHKEDIPEGVDGRWGILIHIANIAAQLAGCIAPGVSREYVTVQIDDRNILGLGVSKSTPAFNTLMSQLDIDDDNFITITQEELSW